MVRVVVPAFLGLVLLVTVVVLVSATVTSRRPRPDAPERNPLRHPAPRPARSQEPVDAAGAGIAGDDGHLEAGTEAIDEPTAEPVVNTVGEPLVEPVGQRVVEQLVEPPVEPVAVIPEQRLDLTAGATRIDLTAADVLADATATATEPPAP